MPNFGNKDIEWCLASYTAVSATFTQSSAVPELYEQMNILVVSLPLGSRAGHATMKWKQDIAEGQHRQEIEKAQQQEKPKL
jgi:hypothetical protein